MLDYRIQSPYYTQVNNPNEDVVFIGGADYTKQQRAKQNQLLQRLADSNKQFAASKSMSAAEQLAQQKLLQTMQKPITSAINEASKALITQLQGLHGLSRKEYDELGKLLQTYKTLKPAEVQRIITLFDKSTLSMEERARLLEVAGNNDTDDDITLPSISRIIPDYRSVVANKNDTTGWNFSSTVKPFDTLNSTSKIGYADYMSTPHPVDLAKQLKDSRDKLKPVVIPEKDVLNDKTSLTPELLKESREKLKPVLPIKFEASNEPTFAQLLNESKTKLKHVKKPVSSPSDRLVSLYPTPPVPITNRWFYRPDENFDSLDVSLSPPGKSPFTSTEKTFTFDDSLPPSSSFVSFTPVDQSQRRSRAFIPRVSPVETRSTARMRNQESASSSGIQGKKKGTAIQNSTRIVYLPSDKKSLKQLFEKGLSSIQAGNKSNEVKNQLSSILDRFVEMGEISSKNRLQILKQYINK